MPDWTRDQPAVTYLKNYLFMILPSINHRIAAKHSRTYEYSEKSHGVGGRVNRTTAKGGRSAHAEGRAADIYLNAETELAIGDLVFDICREYAHELGIDHVIWNGWIWSRRRQMHAYSGNPHKDHVHVAFTRSGSQRVPYRLTIELAKRTGIASGFQL